MKAALVTLIAVVCFTELQAQNWQCLQPSQRVYFTNGYHYLRGVRIDSVRTGPGGTTVFYPFRTPRGAYNTLPWPNSLQLDSTGGSWLGKKVEAMPGGRTLFYNYWNDTVVIETNAAIGAQWVFYSDTTSVWYQATVTGKDTMTIDGAIDSVKKIAIQPKQNGSNVTGVTISNCSILLSKSNGFQQVYDLYMFPFQRPDSPGVGRFDYYSNTTESRYDSASLVYTKSDFHSPTYEQLYDFAPGDIYQRNHISSTYYPRPDYIVTDSIISRSVSATQLVYQVYSKKVTANDMWLGPANTTYTTSYTTNTLTFPRGKNTIIDTFKMPEEWYSHDIYRYNINEVRYIDTGVSYTVGDSYIIRDAHVNTFEPCGQVKVYEPGLGLVDWAFCVDPSNISWYERLIYYRKNGINHGAYYALGMSEIPLPYNSVKTFPNPAGNTLGIEFPELLPCSITICDAVGSEKYHYQSTGGLSYNINTSEWAAGLYILRVQSPNAVYSQKVIVSH